MRHIEFLVEEQSSEKFLNIVLPKLLGNNFSWKIHVHQGKSDLLRKLPNRLKGYAHWLPPDWRIVVLVDQDKDDCAALKMNLEEAAFQANLTTKTSVSTSGEFQVLNRIAIEELEAWFFGDVQAIEMAYPGVPHGIDRKKRFRDPDRIKGGTWEALQQLLQKAGHHKGGLAKVRAARDIANFMDPERNRSTSFRVFVEGLRSISQRLC